ncbi:glycosyltransferase family 4 protein [Flavitalea sp.]|nr:glycosyltransferase family 4 protein [Flavitalea sp.]
MKVLFVCSGNNKKLGIAPFIKQQGESLIKKGIDVDYFPIVGKGIFGYLKAAIRLRLHLRQRSYDLIHAHFALSGWTAVLGTRRVPVVLSLMGDDAYGAYIGVNTVRISSRLFTLFTLLIQPFVKAIISKSQNIEKYVLLKSRSYIIPNGIDIEEFRPQPLINKSAHFSKEKRIILFLGNKAEVRKNYHLVEKAVNLLKLPDVELVNPYPVKHADVPALLCVADVLAVPSLMEGSPNVVKEAMACNCPIVATNTGDVKWVIGETQGCYISSFNVYEFSAKLRLALNFAVTKGRTDGANRLVKLGLDEDCIAKKVIAVYNKVLRNE